MNMQHVSEEQVRHIEKQEKGFVTDAECMCPNGWLVVREGKQGKFLGCSDYPNCRNTYRLTALSLSSPNIHKIEFNWAVPRMKADDFTDSIHYFNGVSCDEFGKLD
jgi:ssDNA-binding Zn-finger/Zn-ribbon topoisomerase 1